MKRSLIMITVGLLVAAAPAHAEKGLSLGISAARANIDAMDVGGFDVDGDSTGMRVFALYEFNDRFGIEAGVSSFGKPDDSSIPSGVEVETESYDVYAVGHMPLSDKLDLFGKIGFVSGETEVEENEEFEHTVSSTDLALALGGEYELTKRISIRGEYQWADATSSGAGRMLSLSGVWSFK